MVKADVPHGSPLKLREVGGGRGRWACRDNIRREDRSEVVGEHLSQRSLAAEETKVLGREGGRIGPLGSGEERRRVFNGERDRLLDEHGATGLENLEAVGGVCGGRRGDDRDVRLGLQGGGERRPVAETYPLGMVSGTGRGVDHARNDKIAALAARFVPLATSRAETDDE